MKIEPTCVRGTSIVIFLIKEIRQPTPTLFITFSMGGDQMDEIADSLGKVLLLPAPRMASPPMEAVLCIDFILSNFAGNEWRNLRDDRTYEKLLQEAQFRLWKPYVDRLASWWSGPKQEKAEILELWPHLA